MIVMEVPHYLKPRKGMRFFQADRRSIKNPDILNLAVTVFQNDEERAEELRSGMRTEKGNDWMGVQQRVLIQGATNYLKDGFELLGKITNTINGDVTNNYSVLFMKNDHNFYVTISGTGEAEFFYSQCRLIICSIRIINDVAR